MGISSLGSWSYQHYRPLTAVTAPEWEACLCQQVLSNARLAGPSSPGGLKLTLYPVLLHLLHFCNGLPQVVSELLPVLRIGSIKVY